MEKRDGRESVSGLQLEKSLPEWPVVINIQMDSQTGTGHGRWREKAKADIYRCTHPPGRIYVYSKST